MSIKSGSWGSSKTGNRAHIDIIEREDGSVRVRLIVRRGETDMATYSDFFATEEKAIRWAEDISVAYGGLNGPGSELLICPVCHEYMWPWQGTDEDCLYQLCHKECITEVNYPAEGES